MVDEDQVAAAKAILEDTITGCVSCLPWAEGETLWFGSHTDIDDILCCGHDFDEDVVEEALKHFGCPSCGCPLEVYCEVRVKSDHELKVEELLSKSSEPAIVDRLKRFSNFLSSYPYLGANDPDATGKEIIETINVTAKAKLHILTFYRARLFDRESRVFKSDEMGAADPASKFIPEGRYNHTGQAFLYLSDREWTAMEEVSKIREDICVMQKYKINDLTDVLDLRADYEDLDVSLSVLQLAIIYNGFVSKVPDHKSSWKPEYFVPRFVADVARNSGFSAILFSSASSGGGENIVVFDPNNSCCKQIDKSYPFTKPKPVGIGILKF